MEYVLVSLGLWFCRGLGGGGGGGFHGLSCIVGLLKMFRYSCMYPGEGAGVSGSPENRRNQVRIQRGTGGPDPPEKSQVIWVSIGNKQLDPPPPLEKVGPPPPPPPPWKMLSLKLTICFCKISWGLQKKEGCQSFFVRLAWTPPPPGENSWIRAWKYSIPLQCWSSEESQSC